MGSAGPPKCKTCGIAEWRHLCAGTTFDQIKAGLKEVAAHRRGEIELPSRTVEPKKAAPAAKASMARSKVVAGPEVAGLPAVAVKAAGRDQAPAGPGTGMGEKAGGKVEAVGFDKAAYQRAYMRDKRSADKLGITVAEFRKLEGPTS